MITFNTKEEYLGALGIDLLGTIVDCKVETSLDNPNYTFKFKILDLVYSISVPTVDTDTEAGIKNVWEHLFTQFAINHERGYKMIQDMQKYKKLEETEKHKLIT
jgi:hypothetical protein